VKQLRSRAYCAILFIQSAALALVAMLAALVLVASPAEAADLRWVSMSGDDAGGTNDCLTQPQPCRTIPHVLSQAADGDTIVFSGDTFDNSYGIVIDKNLTLQGAGAGITVLGDAGAPNLAPDRVMQIDPGLQV